MVQRRREARNHRSLGKLRCKSPIRLLLRPWKSLGSCANAVGQSARDLSVHGKYEHFRRCVAIPSEFLSPHMAPAADT